MVKSTVRPFAVAASLLALALVCTVSARAGVLYSNPLPNTHINTGAGQSDIAPVYSSEPDPNILGSPSEPFILGDQFSLSGGTNSITSFTIYEVGNVATSEYGSATDNPTQEFSALDLYVGADQADLSLASTSYTYSQVQFSDGENYQSINSPYDYYPIFAITFSVSGLTLPAGVYDFAVGDQPIGDNTFALLMGATNGYSGGDGTQTLGNGFYYYLPDGSASGPPKATYKYGPGNGDISGYRNRNEVDALAIVNGTVAPEPSTFAFLALGLGGLVTELRRRVR
ncbi:MAG: PEP-CTERM sorting domain-containing protein [Bryobacteraceae bacterium]|jgi:hypothetical protein